MVQFITLVVILTAIIHVMGIYYPMDEDVTWEETTISELECPSHMGSKIVPLGKYRQTVMMFKLNGKPTKYVKGYFCQKTVLRTTCTTNYLRFSDVDKRELSSKITGSECNDAIKDYSHGLQKFVGYPESKCIWGDTLSMEHVKITITPVDVGYDPYQNSIMHSSLLKGTCKESPCDTIREDQKMWIDLREVEDCQNRSTMIQTAGTISCENETAPIIIESLDIAPSSVKAECRMFFCGIEGVMLSNKEWIDIDTVNVSSSLIAAFSNTAVCEDGAHVKSDSGIHTAEILEEDLLAASFNSRCKESLYKALDRGSISQFDLQKFIPFTPGMHPAYKMENGKLFKGLANYRKLNIAVRVVDHVIGRDMLGRAIRDTEFDHKTTGKVRFGPNGLGIYDNKMLSIDGGLSDLKDLGDST